MRLTGADILAECLLEQGVDTVFGFPGGAVLNIYDSLYKYQHKIRHILTCHEQGASHAADGYARASGKVGVCIATSGPGATNLVTGIATAYMDSVPLVAITGNVALNLLGKDSFQEVDIAGITMPITKHNFVVRDVNKLACIIRKAFNIAKSGRPGPVLVDIPKDITAQYADFKNAAAPEKPEKQISKISISDITEAAEIINSSQKPIIYAGGGVIISEASNELYELATKIQSPVTLTLMGMGAFPATNELYTGMVGMHGTKASNLAVTKCDLLIAIGARFSDRVISKLETFAPNAKILHIDVDEAEVNKNIKTQHYIIGDVKAVLKLINKEIEPKVRHEWLDYVKNLKNENIKDQYLFNGNTMLNPKFILEKINEMTKGDAIIATEVGQHQIWTAQYYKFEKPRSLITSGGLGTMGFGLGAAIGAQLACPSKRVINIAGDGSFRMNFNELITAVKYRLPIIVVIMNNHALGMVRQWQDMFYGSRFSNTTLEGFTDYVKLAEAFGALGFNIARREDVEPVLRQALESNRTVVINCEINPDFKALPMVPPGAALEDVIVSENEIRTLYS